MNKFEQKFQESLLLSTIIHIVVFGGYLLGLPAFFSSTPAQQTVMTFEIVTVSDIDNIQTQEKSDEKEDKEAKEEDYKKVESSNSPIEQKPIEDTKTEKNRLSTKKESKEIIPEENSKKEKKISKNKDKKQEEDDPMASILKNLEKESKGTNVKAIKKTKKVKNPAKRRAFGSEYRKNSPLSITTKSLIRSQIQKHWRKPVGAKDLSQVRVFLGLQLKKDGRVSDVWITKTICPAGASTTCKLAERSIIRAVKKASPLERLPASRYNTWKELEIELAPSGF